jgi:uncharacterized protein (UPF0332 family)
VTDYEVLYNFRLKEAEETLAEAEEMLKGPFTGRAVVNRAYYAMFYAVQALFIKTGLRIKTSKHIGVISIFDKEFVLTGKIDKQYSAVLHATFNLRLEGDYKDLVETSREQAARSVRDAQEFISAS